MVGVVTSFTYNGKKYEVPTSKEERLQFAEDLATQIKTEVEGINDVFVSDWSYSNDSVRLEITLESTDGKITSNLRSVSPNIRNQIEDFTPASEYEVISKPEPVDAEDGKYEDAVYVIDVWWY